MALRWDSHFFSGRLVIVHIPPLPPLQHLEEAKASFEEPIMLENHLMEGIKRQIPTGISMFEGGDGSVEAISLVSKWRIL